jgi:flagellar protein FlgJ
MISGKDNASVYTDFQGLARLRAEAGKETPQAIKETARQFEALFVQMMLKAMREASPGDGMFDSDQVGLYREMYDRQVALDLVKGRGLGIADMLTRQLGSQTEATDDPATHEHALRGGTAAAVPYPVPARPNDAAVEQAAELPAADWQPQTTAEFIQDVWPHARRGAEVLGVDPGVLVAQAALETGWGRKVIQRPDGRNSFNLFNIKADARWDGERVSVNTLEYEHGVAGRQRATFRAYDSIAAAVNDYVEFLQTNPRYRQALERAADPQAFLQGLKEAGYATDPDYVGKIRTIMDQGSFSRQVSELKLNETAALS